MAGAPVPDGGFTVYNSYVTDPAYARYFTYGAAGLLGCGVLATLPSAGYALVNGRLGESMGLGGIVYSPSRKATSAETSDQHPLIAQRRPWSLLYASAAVNKISLRTASVRIGRFRLISGLSLGAILLAFLIPAALLSTLLPESQLSTNSNRAGFLLLATLPWLFLLGGKSNGVSVLTGFSYEKLNYFHRWLGRGALVLVFVHAGLWMSQWAKYGSGYLSDRLSGEKERRGLFAMACLLLLALPSLPIVRRAQKAGWKIFKCLHVVGFVALVVAVNRHTIYAWPWTVGIIVVYGVDVIGRLMRYRIKPVIIEALEPCGDADSQRMTRIRIQNVTDGWRAGQHVRLRLFYPAPSSSSSSRLASLFHATLRLGRPLESHPFSISNAPTTLSVVVPPHSEGTFSAGREIVLYAKHQGEGTWTGDLYSSAQQVAERRRASKLDDPKNPLIASPSALRTTALIDGPYGGLPTYACVDANETVLLFAGGSGMSFVLGVLDDLVGRAIRRQRGERSGKGSFVRKVEVVWCVRDEGCIGWFAPTLDALISQANSSGALSVSLSIHRSSTHTHLDPRVKALESVSTALLHPTRCDVRSKVSEVTQEAVNPCAVCTDCTCPRGPEGCAGDVDECCGGRGAGTVVEELPRSSESQEDDEIVEDLPACCRPAVQPETSAASSSEALDEKEGQKRAGGCCGRCRGSSTPSLTKAKADWDGSEKTVRAGLDVRTGGLGVVVCGPKGMIADVRNAVAAVPVSQAVKIGGIELHSETFGI